MPDYAKELDSIARWMIANGDDGLTPGHINLNNDLMRVARALLKERDAARLEVYYAHRNALSNDRMTVVCECGICEDVIPPIDPLVRAAHELGIM